MGWDCSQPQASSSPSLTEHSSGHRQDYLRTSLQKNETHELTGGGTGVHLITSPKKQDKTGTETTQVMAVAMENEMYRGAA